MAGTLDVMIDGTAAIVEFDSRQILISVRRLGDAWKLRRSAFSSFSSVNGLIEKAGLKILLTIRNGRQFELLPDTALLIRLAGLLP